MRVSDFVCVYVIRPAAGGYELLLGLRSSGRYLSGVWSLITGGIEPGETAWQAALREVSEETGLAGVELYRLSTLTQFYRNDIDSICLAPMFCLMVSSGAQVAINPEHTDLAWVPVEQAAGQLIWATDLAGLAEVRQQILNNGPAKPHLRIPLPA